MQEITITFTSFHHEVYSYKNSKKFQIIAKMKNKTETNCYLVFFPEPSSKRSSIIRSNLSENDSKEY